jgi:hypothetical protein
LHYFRCDSNFTLAAILAPDWIDLKQDLSGAATRSFPRDRVIIDCRTHSNSLFRRQLSVPADHTPCCPSKKVSAGSLSFRYELESSKYFPHSREIAREMPDLKKPEVDVEQPKWKIMKAKTAVRAE